MRAAAFCSSEVVNTVPHKLGQKKGKEREYVQGNQDKITKTETQREADHGEQNKICFYILSGIGMAQGWQVSGPSA